MESIDCTGYFYLQTPAHWSPYFSWFNILQVDSMFETFDQFFNLSPEVKAKYTKKKMTVQNVNPQNGWDAVEVERSVVLDDPM